MPFQCCYPQCKNKYSKSSELNFFSLPKDEERFLLWLELINRPDLKDLEINRRQSTRVCSLHFDECMFAGLTKSRLKSFAFPIAYDTKPQLPLLSPPKQQQESVDIKDFITNPVEEPTARDMGVQTPQNSSERITDEEAFKKYCKQYFNTATANLLISLCEFKQHPEKIEKFALTLYSLHRTLYKFLRKLLQLPSRQELFKFIDQWEIYWGFNNPSLQIIQSKLNLFNDKSKVCVLLIDTLPLKQFLFYNIQRDRIIGLHESSFNKSLPANTAVVFMLKGVYTNWEQLVSYFFINNLVEDVQNVILKMVDKLQNCGLSIKAMITTHKSVFYKFVETNNITLDTPYIFVNNQKVYFMFDMLSLLKSIRDCFLEYTILIKDDLIDIKYVEAFYEKDKTQQYRIVPELTDHHLYPSKIEKQQIKFVSELFNYKLGAGLSTYIALNQLPDSANTTAEFIVQISQLIEIFHSTTRLHQKTDSLLKILEMFIIMKVYDVNSKEITSKLRFIKACQVSINSLLYICYDLENIKVDGRQFCVDSMEKFLDTVKQRHGTKCTPVHFYNCFRRTFALNYLKCANGASSIDDLDQFLYFSKNDGGVTPSRLRCNGGILINSNDYHDFYPPVKNTLCYLLKYFQMKITEQHTCVDCQIYFKKQTVCELSLLQYYLTYKNSAKITKRSPLEFLAFIENLDEMFCNLFPRLVGESNVIQRIKQHLETIEFSKPCKDFPLDYLLLFFVRCRIYYALRLVNKSFKSCVDDQSTIKIRRLWE